jgi:hypothetical protein
MKKNAALLLTASLTFIVMTVCFGFNSSILDERAQQSLDRIVSQLDSFSDYTIHLSGHTDNTGPEIYNDQLSEERAIAVKKYLVSKNIDSTKIQLDFYGECEPVVPNTSSENRALNRRVEVTINGQQLPAPIPQAASPEQPKQDTVIRQEQLPATLLPAEKEIKKRKNRRRLVWTGWRTGFHWSTAGR